MGFIPDSYVCPLILPSRRGPMIALSTMFATPNVIAIRMMMNTGRYDPRSVCASAGTTTDPRWLAGVDMGYQALGRNLLGAHHTALPPGWRYDVPPTGFAHHTALPPGWRSGRPEPAPRPL